MRDTLRPDALPAAPVRPVAGRRRLSRPRAARRGFLCLAAVLCLASEGLPVSFTSPRKPSLVLAPYAAFVFRVSPLFRCSMLCSVSDSLHLVKPYLPLFNALQCSAFRAACQALRPCSVSVSFRLHRARLSLLCSAALVLAILAQALLLLLSHLVLLCWFRAAYFLLWFQCEAV